MKHNPLGRTGLKVSEICLGTMTFGRQNTEAEGHAQMDYALAQGINFFDTAELYAVPPSAETYGRTEEIIGTWFSARKNRDKVILASKVVGGGMPWIRGGKARIDRKNILEAIDASLKRLQTDYIDLYQLHWPNRSAYHFNSRWDWEPASEPKDSLEENFLEVLRTLDELIRAGKIRHVGLSNETAWGTQKWLSLAEKHGLPRMASIQNEYSLLCRIFDWDLAETSLYENVGLLAWSPLAGGMISGKYLNGARPKGSRWAIAEARHGLFRDTPQVNDAVRAYLDLAGKHGLDVCQMAIAFTLSQPFMTASIIGATTMAQLENDIAAHAVKLSPECLEGIEEIRKRWPVPY